MKTILLKIDEDNDIFEMSELIMKYILLTMCIKVNMEIYLMN